MVARRYRFPCSWYKVCLVKRIQIPTYLAVYTTKNDLESKPYEHHKIARYGPQIAYFKKNHEGRQDWETRPAARTLGRIKIKNAESYLGKKNCLYWEASLNPYGFFNIRTPYTEQRTTTQPATMSNPLGLLYLFLSLVSHNTRVLNQSTCLCFISCNIVAFPCVHLTSCFFDWKKCYCVLLLSVVSSLWLYCLCPWFGLAHIMHCMCNMFELPLFITCIFFRWGWNYDLQYTSTNWSLSFQSETLSAAFVVFFGFFSLEIAFVGVAAVLLQIRVLVLLRRLFSPSTPLCRCLRPGPCRCICCCRCCNCFCVPEMASLNAGWRRVGSLVLTMT